MKQYTRPVENKPKKFCDDNAKTEYYNDLYSNDGKIKARWNTLQENNQRAVRKYLLSITNLFIIPTSIDEYIITVIIIFLITKSFFPSTLSLIKLSSFVFLNRNIYRKWQEQWQLR